MLLSCKTKLALEHLAKQTARYHSMVVYWFDKGSGKVAAHLLEGVDISHRLRLRQTPNPAPNPTIDTSNPACPMTVVCSSTIIRKV